jgi:hypothetical protein
MSDWKQDLDDFFRARGEAPRPSTNELLVRRNEEAGAFIQGTVLPAFEEVQAALARYGREALVNAAHKGQVAASIRVRNAGRDEFEYFIGTRVTSERAAPYVEVAIQTGWPRRTIEGALREGAQDYSVVDITKEEVIRHFLTAYKAQLAR